MRPRAVAIARWVQPVAVGDRLAPTTVAGGGVRLFATEIGVEVLVGASDSNTRTVLVPWSNVKQVDYA